LEGVNIKIKSILIVCMLLILIFGIGSSFASVDVDNVQTNDTLAKVSHEFTSAVDDGVKTVDNESIKEGILSSNSQEDILKEDNVYYISPDGTGDGSDADNPTYFDDALSRVTNGGTIKFLPGTYTSIVGKTVNKQISLVGQDGVILDAQNNGRFFTISANNMVFDHIKFINGHVTGDGGAIYSTTQTLSNIDISNCAFENMYASGKGGVIKALNIVNFNFINNTFANCHSST
jgi:predicted outer membrane repeat protein